MKDNTAKIIEILSQEIPSPKSELVYSDSFQLLCAVILSAQCTDKRVNEVTPSLFAAASTPFEMAALPIAEIEKLVHSCGFYHHKAAFLKEASQDIVTRFGGQVPSNVEDLRTLAGVGRKTANVVYAVAFGGQAIAVDTHVFRVSNRLGLTNAKSVIDTERQLMDELPKEKWSVCHHYLLLHGRYVCKSQKPLCEKCNLTTLCKYYQQKRKD